MRPRFAAGSPRFAVSHLLICRPPMTTPMRSQYLAIKKQYPDVIVFFRLGDFYETFDDDAKLVSEVCDVVLTSRPVGLGSARAAGGRALPCGRGLRRQADQRGLQSRHRRADRQRAAQRREAGAAVVRRVVTPGTLVEPGLLSEKRNNYLAALVVDDQGADRPASGARPRAGLAYADISTGEFAATEIAAGADAADMATASRRSWRASRRRALYPAQDPRWPGQSSEIESRDPQSAIRNPPHPYAAWRFEETTARQALLTHFSSSSLDGFGCADKPAAIRAAGALLQYLQETQRDNIGQIVSLRTYSTAEFMTLDEATRRNLELTESIRGARRRARCSACWMPPSLRWAGGCCAAGLGSHC